MRARPISSRWVTFSSAAVRSSGRPRASAGHRRHHRHLVVVVHRGVGVRLLPVDPDPGTVEHRRERLPEPRLRAGHDVGDVVPGTRASGVPAASRAGPNSRSRPSLAADHRHRPGRAQEPRLVDAVTRELAPDRLPAAAGASSASVPPVRSRSRTACSSSENRQLRTAPSAVSRSRSQVPQNGSVTLEMSPISPTPSVKRNRSAGAAPSASGDGLERPDARRSARRPRGPARPVAVPVALGVEGHELDEADDPSGVAGEAGEVEDLVVVAPRSEHDVDLQRREPGRLGGVHGARGRASRSPRRRIAANRSAAASRS